MNISRGINLKTNKSANIIAINSDTNNPKNNIVLYFGVFLYSTFPNKVTNSVISNFSKNLKPKISTLTIFVSTIMQPKTCPSS